VLKFFSTVIHCSDDVLGINARNVDFVYRLNPRKYFPRVDDKLLTKEILGASSVPTPPTLTVFRSHSDLSNLEHRIAAPDGFAVKPAQGFGGLGIMIVRRDSSGKLVALDKAGWASVDIECLKIHISYILSGLYSLEKLSDRAFLEQLLEPEETLGKLSYGGIPDIRVIVYQGQPVMAMARFPTRLSHGRANLHQGAFALGIDIRSGQTTYAVWRNRNIASHPETGEPLASVKIPEWKYILEMSVKAAKCVQLGYLGADIVIDRRLGPLVMELNARPGLTIQLANKKGLVKKLYGDKEP